MSAKKRVGTVISDKMQRTIVVVVENRYKHSIYRKTIVKNKKYLVHDDENTCSIGDIVSITETRPLSKNKRWTLNQIIKKVKN